MSVLTATTAIGEQITTADVQTTPGLVVDTKYTDEAAIRIVMEDFQTAEAWLSNANFPLQWRESKVLYQAPRGFTYFDGGARSAVPRFTVAKQVNSLAPAIHAALFSDTVPFEVAPRPKTKQQAAWAWKHLVATLLDECKCKQVFKTGIEGLTNQGTVIFKWGWETKTVIEKHMVRKEAPPQADMPIGNPVQVYTEASDEFDVEEVEVTTNRPWIEKRPLGSVYVDPKWNTPNDLESAAWVIDEFYCTYDDLKTLAQQNDEYDIPSEEVLRKIFFGDQEQTETQGAVASQMSVAGNGAVVTAEGQDRATSADPLLKPMQVLERWTGEECMAVLQGKVIIRNSRHELPGKPFGCGNYWNMEDTGWGLGVGRIAGADQRVDTGILNSALDIIAFAANPEYVVSRGANASTQEMRRRLGGVRAVDGDPRQAFALMEQPKVPSDMWQIAQASVQASESATGADQATVQGAIGGAKSSFGRSGTGAGAVAKASGTRLQSPVENLIDGAFLPFLNFCWTMVRERMPVSEIRSILGDAETQDLMVDMHDFLNARLKFDTLAGTRLAARAQMSAAMPFLLQVFQNQALVEQLNTTGYKVDVQMLADMVMEISEWRNKRQLIVPLTDQEKQQKQQANPAAGKLQNDMAILQQKHSNDMDMEDLKIKGRMAAQAADHAMGSSTKTPVDRAEQFAAREQDEQRMKQSAFFGDLAP